MEVISFSMKGEVDRHCKWYLISTAGEPGTITISTLNPRNRVPGGWREEQCQEVYQEVRCREVVRWSNGEMVGGGKREWTVEWT